MPFNNIGHLFQTIGPTNEAHLERRRSSDYDPWYQEPMKLFHGLQIDDTVGFTHPNDNDLTTSIATGSPSAISGTWGGYLCLTTDPSTTYFHLPVINLLVDNNGVVFGVGSSWWGDQVIRGSVEGNHVEMDRMVIPHPRMQESQVLRTQRYIGTLNDRLDEMKGTYGLPMKMALVFQREMKPSISDFSADLPPTSRLIRNTTSFWPTDGDHCGSLQ